LKTFSRIQSVFLSFILLFITTTHESWAQVNNTTPPPGAIQVTPEEFQAFKKDELKDEKAVGANFIQASGGGKETPFLIFAVVGTGIVVAWIPYTVLLAYRSLKNPELYKFTSILSASVMNIDKGGERFQKRRGLMSSLRWTPMSALKKSEEEIKKNPYDKFFGLNFELGYYDFHDEMKQAGVRQDYHSPYWLVGPSIVLGDFILLKTIPLFLRMDLLAGTSFHQDVDLITKADLSLNFLIGKGSFIGFGVTAFYLYGREGKGIINHVSDLSTQFAFTTGYRF
jgi:hypothetical protein